MPVSNRTLCVSWSLRFLQLNVCWVKRCSYSWHEVQHWWALLPPFSEHGFIGYTAELLKSNTMPDYSPGEHFFTVFGVFFPAATGLSSCCRITSHTTLTCYKSTVAVCQHSSPAFNCCSIKIHFALYNMLWTFLWFVCACACVGVMAGFNMSSDLQRPEHNIPVGTLAAVFTSYDNTPNTQLHNSFVKIQRHSHSEALHSPVHRTPCAVKVYR